jgi:uncharacterized protein
MKLTKINNTLVLKESPVKVLFLKVVTWSILIILLADAVYSIWNGINFQTKDKCLIYKFLPRWFFLINEYFVELFMVVVAGAFAGVVAEKYFMRFRKFYPKNQITAFLYASLIPVCSCSAVPLIESMKSRLNLRAIVSFVVAAPLLNPYIIFLSFSVLGVKYGVLRIIGAFLVSIISGIVVEWSYKLSGKPDIGAYRNCKPTSCSSITGQNIYSKTWKLILRILPYVLIASILGLLFELTGPLRIIEQMPISGNFSTLLILTSIGVVVYLCNGADILFLAPLLAYTDLGISNAMAFSLTSTAICISSIVMLGKFLGRKLTSVLVISIFMVVICFSVLIRVVF